VTSLAGAFCGPLIAGAQQIPRIGWLTNSVVHTANVDLEVRDSYRRRPGSGRGETGHCNDSHRDRRGHQRVHNAAGTRSQSGVPGRKHHWFTISTGTKLYGKRIQLLREAIPRLSRIFVVWNPHNEGARISLPAVEAAANAIGIQSQPIAAPNIEQLERGLGDAPRTPAAAVLTVADAFLWSQRARIVSLATRHRLAGMYPEREFAVEGGLMAYGSNVPDNFRRAAGHVDKILKGAKPAAIPVEQPTTFDLVINLKTAKALGLTIPPSLLARADQVIE
jgi:putative tryptophan/tyrosine transport system substrate-binding protein